VNYSIENTGGTVAFYTSLYVPVVQLHSRLSYILKNLFFYCSAPYSSLGFYHMDIFPVNFLRFDIAMLLFSVSEEACDGLLWS